MKHTSGPWVASADGSIRQASRSNGQIIATAYVRVRLNPDHFNEMRANADLIAAAPDLLAALQTLMKGSVERDPNLWHEAKRAARAAIAKATGETT